MDGYDIKRRPEVVGNQQEVVKLDWYEENEKRHAEYVQKRFEFRIYIFQYALFITITVPV